MLALKICPHETVPVVRLPEKALLVHDMSDAEQLAMAEQLKAGAKGCEPGGRMAGHALG